MSVVASELGVSEMFSNQVRAHIQADSKVLMVVDGDQASVRKIYSKDPDELSSKEKIQVVKDLKDLNISIIGSNEDLDGWMRWCKSRVIVIDQVCPEKILLELVNPTHALLANATATNAEFKSAVKSAVKVTKGDSASDAQYHILRFKLGEVKPETPIGTFVKALSDQLKDKLAQFDPA